MINSRRDTLVGAETLAGAALLLDPEALLSRVGLVDSTPGARRLARLLGARQLAQALLLAFAPSGEAAALASVIDATHCTSMLVLARLSARYRRAALSSAVIAAMFCLWELWASSVSDSTRAERLG